MCIYEWISSNWTNHFFNFDPFGVRKDTFGADIAFVSMFTTMIKIDQNNPISIWHLPFLKGTPHNPYKVMLLHFSQFGLKCSFWPVLGEMVIFGLKVFFETSMENIMFDCYLWKLLTPPAFENKALLPMNSADFWGLKWTSPPPTKKFVKNHF